MKPAKNVAILTGGNVAERGISLKSAKTIKRHLSDERYQSWIIELNGRQFVEQSTGQVLDMNDFSLNSASGTVHFDLVFLILHGHPAEDGSILGYFELLGIPCTGCDHLTGALTFNKQLTKDFLRPHGIPMANSRVLRRGHAISAPDLQSLGLPLFVKPNKNGSSYGVTKVTSPDELMPGIEKAFEFDDEVIVEQFMDGVEFSNGVFRNGTEVVVLPVTEIRSDNDFFDYAAKYENASQEITPAELSDELRDHCQALTRNIYTLLNCKGMCRVDYILVDGVFHLLEINTIPGMSEQSIVPQQVRAAGWTLTKFLDAIVQEAIA